MIYNVIFSYLTISYISKEGCSKLLLAQLWNYFNSDCIKKVFLKLRQNPNSGFILQIENSYNQAIFISISMPRDNS